jgi:3D (Asp-Asp-Asp) domain-containing protein
MAKKPKIPSDTIHLAAFRDDRYCQKTMKIRLSRIVPATRKKARFALSAGAFVTGLAITFSVFAATIQTVAAPQDIDELLEEFPALSTIQENSFIQHNIPETPLNGYRTIEEYIVTVTGYSSTSDQTDGSPFTTASNEQVQWGYAATNLLLNGNIMPFGTKIMIPELFDDEVFEIQDRMNRRYSDRVDIWFPSKDPAKKFGVRSGIAIYVVEKIE